MSAATAAAQSGFASSARTFRLLLWLKWTLIWRAYSRERVRIVGGVIMVLMLAPLSIGVAVVCFLFGRDSPALAPLMSRAILGIAYAAWLVTPLLGFPLNESYDPTRLFVYPVRLRLIFAASVVGGLFELTTLLAAPIFVALVLLFSTDAFAAVFAVAAMLFFLLHTLATAQLVMLALIGFLRSRRFRDITIVVFPLIAMSIYIAQQAAVRHMMTFRWVDILSSPAWSALAYLPPGWATEAARLARGGAYSASFGYLCLLAVSAATPVVIASAVMKNMYLGDRGSAPTREPSAPAPAAPVETGGGNADSAAPHREIGALVGKEWRYLVREPQYKALAVNMLYTIVALFFAFGMRQASMPEPAVWQPGSGGDDGSAAFASPLYLVLRVVRAFTLPTVLLLATLPLTFNVFGGDASAITVLLSFPVARRKILIAKNIAYAPVVVGLCVLGVGAGAYLLRQTELLPLELVWVLIATPVVMGAGNLVSVRFPHKLMVRGQRFGRGGNVTFGSGPSGCGYGLVYLACYLAAFATLSPVAASVMGPVVLGDSRLLWLTIPLAALYSAGIYLGATTAASSLLQRRESEIVSILAPDE